MRVIGAIFLIVGIALSVALAEPLGLLPMTIGILLLLVKEAKGLVTGARRSQSKPPPSRMRWEFLEPEPENLSPEVTELFERLTRKRVDGGRP